MLAEEVPDRIAALVKRRDITAAEKELVHLLSTGCVTSTAEVLSGLPYGFAAKVLAAGRDDHRKGRKPSTLAMCLILLDTEREQRIAAAEQEILRDGTEAGKIALIKIAENRESASTAGSGSCGCQSGIDLRAAITRASSARQLYNEERKNRNG